MKNRAAAEKEYVQLQEKERRRCRAYYQFFKRAWREIEPNSPFVDNWHIKYLCDILEAEAHRISKRELKTSDYIVNISPRSSKSSIISVFYCPWVWTLYPWIKFLGSSHSNGLSLEHSTLARDLIQTEWYQSHWGDVFQLSSDQNVKGFFANDKRGRRVAVSVGAKIAGKGADIITVDDLLDIEEANSQVEIEKANNHWNNAIRNRLNDQKTGLRVLVMQRLHENDPTGSTLKLIPEEYIHINIPAELTNESKGTPYDVQPKELEQFYKDGLFFPERFPKNLLDQFKKLGEKNYANQFLQRVSVAGGNIFKRKDFKFYTQLPKVFEKQIQVWDMSFKEGEDNSFVVGQVWGRLEGKNYLIHQYRKQVGFSEARRAVLMQAHAYPHARKIFIEDKANGPAIEDSLRKIVPGRLELWKPGSASKESRMMAIAYVVENGNVYVPEPSIAPWVIEFLNECDTVPNATFNDQADSMTIALTILDGKGTENLKKLLNF